MDAAVIRKRIASVAELRRLGGARHFLLQRSGSVTIEYLPPERREYWEREVNRYYAACGCGTGKVMVVLFLAGFIGMRYFEGGLEWSWGCIGQAFLSCMAGAFTGKGIGIISALTGLRKVIRKMQSENTRDASLLKDMDHREVRYMV